MAETGQARNVERFTQLVSFVTSYGADYAPSNTKITILNLQTKLTASLAAIDGVSTFRAPLTVAVNERQNAFADLRRLTTRVVNAFAASGAPQNAVDDAKTLKRKIDGVEDGDYFGEISLLANIPTTATVTTLTPGIFITLQREQLNRLVHQYAGLGAQMREALEHRLAQTYALTD